ncbi:hypothetical protein NpPPO83_00006631 [Neofusicoccum parvum]|uniref:Uncharacterized protein n=1 Tax=Neofusicoccum parvum TaxID=310453 RepID=A0ACB5SP15_9PEZI|nr:hypothetical protein NpPPO83_00006631 [Neofusicoccum parvum]
MKKKIPRASLQQEKARRSYLQRHHSNKRRTPPVKNHKVKMPKQGVQAPQPTPKHPLMTTPSQVTPTIMTPSPMSLGIDLQNMDSRLTILEDHMADAFQRFNGLNENQRRMGNHIQVGLPASADRQFQILAKSMAQALMKATNQQYRDLTFHVRAFEHLSTVVNRQNARVQEMDEAIDAHEDKIQELRYDPATNSYEPFKYDVEDDIRNSFVPDCSKRDVVNKWLPNVGENTTAALYGPEPEQHCDSVIHDSANTPSYEDAYDTSSSKPDISDGPQMEAAAPDPATAPALSLASASTPPAGLS